MFFRKYKVPVLITLLFLLSLGLRLLQLNHINQFGDDHGRDALYVWDHIQTGTPFVLGPKASVGDFYVMPFYYYLMAIPFWLSNGWPTSASLMIVLVESFTPVILFLIGFRHWSIRSGIAMGILYAVSPFAITFSVFAWNPNMIPFFSSLMFLAVCELIKTKSKVWPTVAIVAAMLAFQLHYQAFILFFFLGPVVIWSFVRQPTSRKWWLVAILAGASTLLPLLFDLTVTLNNFTNIWHFFREDHSQFYQRTRLLPFFTTSLPSLFETFIGVSSPSIALGRLLLGFSLLHLTLRVLEAAKSGFTRYTSDLILLGFFLSSLVGMRIYRGDKHEFYLLFCVYLPVCLLSSLLNRLGTNWKATVAQVVTITLVSVLATSHQPLFTASPQHDYQILSTLIHKIESEAGGESYTVVDVPYKFYRDSLKYIWPREVNKNPFDQFSTSQDPNLDISSSSIAPVRRIYICKQGDNCLEDHKIIDLEEKLGFRQMSKLEFSQEGRSFEVYTLKKP